MKIQRDSKSVVGILIVAVLLACAGVLAGPASRPDADVVVRPQAKAQTEPVPSAGDAADDPAIWVHPTDPEKSLILGTDKLGGLNVFNLDGSRRQIVSDGSRPNNVDVLYGFKLGDRLVDLAVASCRGRTATGVKVWQVDPDKQTLSDVTAGGTIPVLATAPPYGLCVYRSAKTGSHYFFVNSPAGHVEQYLLRAAADNRVAATRVRAWKLSTITEGCVADDELGHLYVAAETVGIWKFPAEPDAEPRGTLIARVGQHGLTADVEGLTLYAPAGGRGYLIASSQGSSTFLVYTREEDNRYVLTLDPKAGDIDDVSDTDGIAVTHRATSQLYPAGLLVVQDGHKTGSNQNFKLYDWRDIAAGLPAAERR